MFLLINPDKCDLRIYLYGLNTSHVLINRRAKRAKPTQEQSLNTSHVLINRKTWIIMHGNPTSLNTSHVLINPEA